METKTPKHNRYLVPLILFFIVINGFLLVCRNWLTEKGFSVPVLQIGNLLLFALFLLSALMHRSAATVKPGSQAFLRPVYGGMLLKLFGCAIAAFLYIFIAGQVNKPAVFGCMFLYVVYTIIDLRTVLTGNKTVS